MILNWEAPLACGHTAYGKGEGPNPGDDVWCEACQSQQDITGRIYVQNW